MANMMKTGIPGLDRVLCGGFLYHNAILLKGAPGCGKTTLGMQVVVNGATMFDEPGIVVLFEQFPQQLYRDVASYGWDLQKLVNENKLRVIFSEPDHVTSSDRMVEPPLVAQIADAVAEIGARRIVIDSLSHIIHLAEDNRGQRELLLRFINALKRMGLTPIMTAEAESQPDTIGVDEYLTDCVLHLSSEATRDPSFVMRQLRVRKTRGHDHLRGRHMVRLSDSGFEVFPRTPMAELERQAEERASAAGTQQLPPRRSTGISGLDTILGGGLVAGTSTIVAGMPGTYKTTLAMQFATKGLADGERALVISFSESPTFLRQVMAQKGMPVSELEAAGKLALWHVAPKETYVEELLWRLEDEIRRGGVTRVVVDSLNDVERGVEDPQAYADIVGSFLGLFAAHGVTSLFTQKIEHLTGGNPLADIGYAAQFDGIIYLGSIEIESSVHKVISVLKMRGGTFNSDLREVTCDADGLTVKHKFVGLSGILSGNARGQYKKNVEELFQPLYFIRDFIEMLATQQMDDASRAAVVENLRGESNKLVAKLKTHFDLKN